MFNTSVAALAGLILGVGLAFLIDYLDVTFTQSEGVENALNLPTLATIPSMSRRDSTNVELMAHVKPASPYAESYRMLRTNIIRTDSEHRIGSLLVTSALVREGKTTTVANLGVVMAQAGLRVLLVDADLRHPSLHKIFKLPNNAGLVDLLQTDSTFADSDVTQTVVPNLSLLAAGSRADKPAELIGSERMDDLIDQMSWLWEVVLLDSPPVLAVTDGVLISNRVDGVVLVIRAGHTPKDEVKRAQVMLNAVDSNIVGTVLNRGKTGSGYYYYPQEDAKSRGLIGAINSGLEALSRRWHILFLPPGPPDERA